MNWRSHNKSNCSKNGYDVNWFVNKPSDDYICVICKNVGRSLMESECGHIFCEKCITSWLSRNKSCPVDRQPLSTETEGSSMIHPMFHARRKVLNMKIKCPNGCGQIINVRNIKIHQGETCKLRNIECGVCDKPMVATEIKSHMDESIGEHMQTVSVKVKRLKTERDELLRKIEIILSKQNGFDERLKKLEVAARDAYSFNDKGSSFLNLKTGKILYNLLKSKIPEAEPTLIFQSTKHGATAASFHSHCDRFHRTLVVIKANNRIFGGYNPLNWAGNQYKYGLGEAFLFALEGNYIFTNTSGNTYSVYCSPGYGPTFGSGHDLVVWKSNDSGCETNVGQVYKCTALCNETIKSTTCLAGSKVFHPTEVEVYSL